MLLHRYHNIDYVLQLDVEIGSELIWKAMESELDERIHRQWVAQLPIMAYSGKQMSFSEYKNRVTGANIDRRSTAEILAELDDLERDLQKGGDA